MAGIWNGNSGFSIWDRTDLQNLELVGGCNTSIIHPRRVSVYGDYAYVIAGMGSEGISVISIEDPGNPREIYVVEEIDDGNNISIVRDLMFVCDGTAGIKIFDLEDPERPELVARYDTPACATGMAIDIDEGYIYVADFCDISIYDMSRVLGIWNVQVPDDSHDFGEVDVDSSAAWEVTITNAAVQPVDVLSVTTDSAAFSVEFDEAVTLDPGEEATVSVVFTPTESRGYAGALTIHTERRDVIVELSGAGAPQSTPEEQNMPHQFALHPTHPNPFNDQTQVIFSLDRPCRASVLLYDLAGREVIRLADGRFSAGAHQVALCGDGLAAGIYLLRLESAGRTAARNVVLVR